MEVCETKKTFTPKQRTWKLKIHNLINLFKDRLTHLFASDTNEKSAETQWTHLKSNLLKATDETCGFSKQKKWHKQTLWWDNSVNYVVNEKEDFLRFGKKGSSKEDYTSAKKVAKHRICSKEKG